MASTTEITAAKDRSMRQLNMVCTVRARSAQVATAQDDMAIRVLCQPDCRNASTVSRPFSAESRWWAWLPKAARSAAYRAGARRMYERRASQYSGTPTRNASPNRQSRANRPIRVSRMVNTVRDRVGSTCDRASETWATSSLAREIRSPVPERSTRSCGRARAVDTNCSRRVASSRSSTRAASSTPSTPSTAAAITATAMPGP